MKLFSSIQRFLIDILLYFRKIASFPFKLFVSSVQKVEFVPVNDLSIVNNGFYSSGVDPQFIVHTGKRHYPYGWVLFSYCMKGLTRQVITRIYIDTGKGYSETDAYRYISHAGITNNVLIKLPFGTRGLRFDPMEEEGSFNLEDMEFKELSYIKAFKLIRSTYHFNFIKTLRYLFSQVDGKEQEEVAQLQYDMWFRRYLALNKNEIKLIKSYIKTFADPPLISVIMPVYNTDKKLLKQAIKSIVDQVYTNWQLCIIDDASDLPHIKNILETYKSRDNRITTIYRASRGGIAAATNEALSAIKGKFTMFTDHDDLLEPHALCLVADTINRQPDVNIIYTDSDHIDENGAKYRPFFKPDWSYDYFLGANYLNHLTAIRTSLLLECGGLRYGYDGSQDYDLLLRAIEKIPPSTIFHIPMVLYHWRSLASSFSSTFKSESANNALKAINDHFSRCGIAATAVRHPTHKGYQRIIRQLPNSLPLVSVIIPTRDNKKLLSNSVESVLVNSDYKNVELLIIDNGSEEPDTLEYFKLLEADNRVTLIHDPRPFNFSRLCNLGVMKSNGKVIGLLNNDIQSISRDWISELTSHALREHVGVAGAKLYYDDDRIQHAGVVLGIKGVAGHIYKYSPRSYEGDHARLILTQYLSAVTFACAFFRREIFDEVGGFNETDLSIAFNDIDFCLRVRNRGYDIVWSPFAELYHLESASRGLEDTPEKQDRFRREIEYMQRTWGDSLLNDPFYSPNLSLNTEDLELAHPPRYRYPWNNFQLTPHQPGT